MSADVEGAPADIAATVATLFAAIGAAAVVALRRA